MPELTNKSSLTATVIKSEDLPEDVVKAAEGEDIDQWFYASVEVSDRDGDIVRIKGMDTKSYTQSGGAIKFISSHKKDAGPDGRLPVVGKAVRWQRTTHKSIGAPAMAVGIKFAPTPLGQEFKSLYEGGFLSDVSIGFKPKKATPIKGAGYDIEESAIGELSACLIGANQFAGLMKALVEDAAADAPVAQEIRKHLDLKLDELSSGILAVLKSNKDQINKRLDDLEAAVVAKSQEPEPTGDNDPAQEPEYDWATLRDAVKALHESLPTRK